MEDCPALNQALQYLSLDLSVIPLSPRSKKPLIPWAEYQQRRATEEEVRCWYKDHSDAGIAIVCGAISNGLTVIDVDPRNNGQASIVGKHLPPTPAVRTGGGGFHYYFRAPGFIKVTGLLPGVDLQAEGSYVVAPPSVHEKTGESYEWSLPLEGLELEPLPEWARQAYHEHQAPPPPQTGHKPAATTPRSVKEGGRNAALVKYVGSLLARRLSEGEALNLALEANATFDPPLERREVEAVVRSIAKRETLKPQEGPKLIMSLRFEGLVDIVEHEGQPTFLVRAGDGGPILTRRYEAPDGEIYTPPPSETLTWLLPRSTEVLRHIEEALSAGPTQTDERLLEDLIIYHSDISDLPHQGYYLLLALFAFHTHLTEGANYSPIISFFGVPERGKSRTCRGLAHVARRGVIIESLREPYIIRAARDFHATLVFDVLDLWKKAEAQNSCDLLLNRFERGATVPRVLYPERGPFKDIVFYDVFGPTVIATNKPMDYILDTRCISVQMGESTRAFEQDVSPARGLALKERLTAFRFRRSGASLPEVEKPARGRLGDICRHLRQLVRLISPRREEEFMDLVREAQRHRTVEKSETLEAQLLLVVSRLEGKMKNGNLPVKAVTEEVNTGKREREQLTPQRVGRVLSSLGFEKTKTGNGSSAILFDRVQLGVIMRSYGLAPGVAGVSDGPQTPPEGA